MDDISYNDDQQTKYMVMQLLERGDGKKWFVWTKQGKLASQKFNTTVKDFYNKYDAMVEYEQLFLKKTANKWSERQYFQQRPGQYILIRRESEHEIIKKFKELDKEIFALIAEGETTHTITKVSDHTVRELVRQAWDIDHQRRVMADHMLDVERLPLGRLQRDQIVKCYKILSQIQKILLSGERGKESVVNALSNDYYSTIPHNYGVKKPVMIDHLLRIKEKLRVLEQVSYIQASQSLLTNMEVELKLSHPIDVQYGLLSCQVLRLEE